MPVQKLGAAQPSTSKANYVIKEEDSFNDSTDPNRTQFVLVTKPKFIKVEGGNDNQPQPSSPRKIQNVTIEGDEEDDADVAVMKNSQSSDDGRV